MKVVVNHCTCEVKDIHSVVPQGSDLGPLLFLFYVKFLTNDIVSSTKILANDLKFHIKINTANNVDNISDLCLYQTNINTLIAVSKSWGLSISTME